VVVHPDLYDALVPSMLLQPIIENAYVHGLSRTEAAGTLVLEGTRLNNAIKLTVTNTGIGLNPKKDEHEGHGVGLRNVQRRLDLHYGSESHFEISQIDPKQVRVTIVFPLQYQAKIIQPIASYGTLG